MHIILGMYFSYACFYWLQKVLWYSGPKQKYRKLYTSISQQTMTAFSTYFLFRGLRSAGKMIITVMDQIRLTLEKNPDDVIKWKHFPCYWPFVRGDPSVTDGFPSQRLLTRSFDVYFDLQLNKRLSKQSRRRWFETPSRSLWRHCNDNHKRHYLSRWCTLSI